jgi:hypothetical protein
MVLGDRIGRARKNKFSNESALAWLHIESSERNEKFAYFTPTIEDRFIFLRPGERDYCIMDKESSMWHAINFAGYQEMQGSRC